MASHYRRQVEHLHTALLDGDETNQIEAKEIIRSLIDAIVLTPNVEGLLDVEVRAELAGI